MKATGALPTEERVMKMNDIQWLWYYFNLLKDDENDEKKWKSRLEYIGWFVNPELAKSVIERDLNNNEESSNINNQNNIHNDTEQYNGDIIFNDDFEKEFKEALKNEGISEDEFVVLPDSTQAGNPNESKEDFLARVMMMQNINDNEVEIPIGFESKEEYEEHLKNQIKSNEDKKDNINNNEKDELKDIIDNLGIDPDEIDYFEYPEDE